MHDEFCILCPQTQITWLKTVILLVFANKSFKLSSCCFLQKELHVIALGFHCASNYGFFHFPLVALVIVGL